MGRETSLRARGLWLLVLCAPLSCGDDGGSGGYVGGVGPGGGVPHGSGLTGTWQGTGSRAGGAAREVTVTVGADLFSVSAPGGSLLAQRSGEGFSISYTQGSVARQAVAQPTSPRGAGLGDIPVDVSGAWKVSNPVDDGKYGCTSQLSDEGVSAACASVSGLPRFLPDVSKGSATASRSQPLSSSFGALGGEWTVALSGGGSCLVRFEGSAFSSTCTEAGPFTGTMQVTLNGNTASGTTSEGYEFSAQRQ